MRKFVLIAMIAGCWPVASWGQTNDAFWGPWTSREERFAATLEGLGGAGVARTDDAASASVNPALLATLTRSEVLGGVATRDETQFGLIGGGGVLKHGLALGGYVHRPGLVTASVPGGSLDYEVTEGAAVAAKQFGRVAVGLGVRVSRLALSGLSETQESEGPLLVGSEAGNTRVGGTLGLAYTSEGLTVGVSYRTKDTYEATRTSQLDRLTDDAGSTYDVRRPSRLSAGLAYRWGSKAGVFSQADFRQAGVVKLVPHRGAPGATWSAEEGGLSAFRAGLEYAVPFGAVSAVLRGGVRYTAESGITSTGDAALFPGTASETAIAGGLSLVFKGGSLDIGGSKGGFAAEGRLRF